MFETLNLTPEQKTKIEEIHGDAMQKSKAAMDEAEAKLRPMLTPEQQKKMDE